MPVSSLVTDAPTGKAVLLLDTGAAYMYAPSSITTAIYGNVKGAKFDSSAGKLMVSVRKTLFSDYF